YENLQSFPTRRSSDLGSVTGASGASYTVAPGNFALSPTQIQAMDPQDLGPDPTVLTFMKKTYPPPNDTTVGDGVNTSGFRFAARSEEHTSELQSLAYL